MKKYVHTCMYFYTFSNLLLFPDRGLKSGMTILFFIKICRGFAIFNLEIKATDLICLIADFNYVYKTI